MADFLTSPHTAKKRLIFHRLNENAILNSQDLPFCVAAFAF